MNFSNLFKHNLAIVSCLAGFTTGSLSTSIYYQSQRKQEIRAFLECQAAWEKYYQLDQPINQQYSQAISQKLNTLGLRINPNLISTVWYLAQQQWPSLNFYNQKEHRTFTLDQEKYLVHQEILLKCQKIKDWERYMKHLTKA